MKVVIIDYGAGNIFSVQQAFRRIGVETILSADEKEIRSASHVVFPGVGHAKPAMEQLKSTGLDQVILDLKQPVLGVCLGMQLMCGWNEEGDLEGLGIFDTPVFELKSRINKSQKFENRELDNFRIRVFEKFRRTPVNTDVEKVFKEFKTPHIGWNDVYVQGKSDAFYFVHSYAAEICDSTVGISEYPFPFSASLQKENFWGVQFHPEKSGSSGEKFLKDFLGLKTYSNSQISELLNLVTTLKNKTAETRE